MGGDQLRNLIEALGFAVTIFMLYQTRTKDREAFVTRIAIIEERVENLWKWFMGDKETRKRIGRALDERDERNGGTQ